MFGFGTTRDSVSPIVLRAGAFSTLRATMKQRHAPGPGDANGLVLVCYLVRAARVSEAGS